LIKKKEYQVEFIDYGNIEWVKLNDLIKLDGKNIKSSTPSYDMWISLFKIFKNLDEESREKISEFC